MRPMGGLLWESSPQAFILPLAPVHQLREQTEAARHGLQQNP